MEIEELWLGLCPIQNIHKIRLIEEFGTAKRLLDELLSNEKYFSSYPKLRNKLLSTWQGDDIKRTIEYMGKENIKFITCENINYNKNLLNLGLDRPYILFYKGDINRIDSMSAAVVGSRNCTPYGAEICKSIIKELIALGINIISGGAMGIDTIAHRETLNLNGFTAAVLGSGINILYPSVNEKLLKKISEEGVLISEFPLGTKPFSYNFPIRNRIISGLSDIIIVVEASEDSGSCITGRLGADQGKDVFAVPGALTMKNSRGCNKLINEGAHIYLGLESFQNILDFHHKWNNKEKSLKKPTNHSHLEETILKIISNKPVHIDEILAHTCIDIDVLYSILFEMQLKEEIINLSGSFYARIIN
ncbi:DNA-processing protein DprA [Alloiococcus sp. CFN-8]|uniref:DNA-processing protein DprA n=1 Tax=Alloiococcus sp. CFN-8 TaxID=3416081 RepID=UPI003CF94B58